MNRSNTLDSQMHTSSTLVAQKYKLVFLGDQSVGKTSIINRFIFDTFDGKDHPTVGIDFISKTLYHDDKSMKLQLWDTAGQERFRTLIPSYIRDCHIAIIVYDITSRSSFNNLSKWVEDVRNERGADVVLVIVGNKTDMADKRVVPIEEGDAKSKELETMYLEVSANTGNNIKELFQLIASYLPGNEFQHKYFTTEPHNQTSNNINLMDKSHMDENLQPKKKCSC